MSLQQRRILVFVAAIATPALALGGCSRQADQPSDQAAIEQPVRPEPAAEQPALADTRPAPVENQTKDPQVEVPPATPVSREAQMLDDAAASGMTARLPRDKDGASDAEDGAPANTH